MADRIPRPPALSTFGIGSLPHTQLELALQVAFGFDIPTLPQLPRGDAAEFMLPQALDGMPGLQFDGEGRVTIERAAWEKGSRAFNAKLDAALKDDGLPSFEPTPTTCRAWQPFVWEAGNRRVHFVKAQLAGPITTLWATSFVDGTPARDVPELGSQIHRLVLARALAMVSALAGTGATPILFLDEPGLYAFNPKSPTEQIELRGLDFAIAALRKAGALVGLHCCGNTDWSAIAKLELDFISADARLSLGAILSATPALDEYLARGGWLGLGIVPTSDAMQQPVAGWVAAMLGALGEKRARVLARSVLSPACGLAMRTVAESERILDDLREAKQLLKM